MKKTYVVHMTVEVDPAKLDSSVAVADLIQEIVDGFHKGGPDARKAGLLDSFGINAVLTGDN